MLRFTSCSIILSMSCFLCFVAFFKMFLFFVWTSFSHSSCTPHASSFTLVHIFFFFPSFLLIQLFIRDKKGEKILWLMHILRGRNSTSCTFIGGEIHRGDAYIKGEKTFFYEKTLFYLMLVFSMFYGALCSILYCSHRIMFMCWTCIHPHACSDDHLLCYVVIVVISIWLFWCMIKLLICFTSCLLDRNLLGTLYLSFYYLLYLEGLMCFVQVF